MAGSNWQQLSGGSTNPWTIRRDDGTPTANYGDHIICDGGAVTLPSPQANEAVLVSNISSTTTIEPNGTETIEGESSVLFDQTDPIAFVSDGANWYVSNNLDYFRTIPDSAIAHYDALSAFDSGDDGTAISTWPDELGNNDATGGNPIVRENAINGERGVEFNHTNSDVLEAAIKTVSQPFTILAAVDFGGNIDNNRALVGDRSTNSSVQYNSDDQWVAFFGSRLNGSSDQAVTVVAWVIDAADSASYEDSTSPETTGDAGSLSWDALKIGAENDPAERFWDGMVGEVLPCEADLRETGELSNQINRMLSRWSV